MVHEIILRFLMCTCNSFQKLIGSMKKKKIIKITLLSKNIQGTVDLLSKYRRLFRLNVSALCRKNCCSLTFGLSPKDLYCIFIETFTFGELNNILQDEFNNNKKKFNSQRMSESFNHITESSKLN